MEIHLKKTEQQLLEAMTYFIDRFDTAQAEAEMVEYEKTITPS